MCHSLQPHEKIAFYNAIELSWLNAKSTKIFFKLIPIQSNKESLITIMKYILSMFQMKWLTSADHL